MTREEFMNNHEARMKELEKKIKELETEQTVPITETKNTKTINELNDLLESL